MLTLRPHPPPTRPPDMLAQCRGRSRQVSQAALARQASEERRTSSHVLQPRLYVRAVSTERNPRVHLVSVSEFITPPPPQHTPSPLNEKSTPLVEAVFDSLSSATIPSIPPTSELISEDIPIPSPVPMNATAAPAFLRSASPSPPTSASLSPDYYDTPPHSLEDQVHVAYVLDDIHLAKVLLLRLKGIEVTSDDDPRIAAVQDEDFDFCFPYGGLMDEQDELMVLQKQKEEQARIEEWRRVERLRECERKWLDEKKRLREERAMVLRRREMKRIEAEEKKRREEEVRQQALENERRRVAHERAEAERLNARRIARQHAAQERKVVSYTSLGASGSRSARNLSPSHAASVEHTPFVYDFMVPTTCPSSSSTRTITKPSPPPPPSLSRSRPQFPAPVFDDSYSISFTDVLKSMQGPLFPISNDERIERSNSPAQSKSKSKTHSQAKRRREADLFQSLVEYVEFDGEERQKRKGKAKVLPRRSTDECAACCAVTLSSHSPSSPISPTPSVSSSISRTSSWLSFGSSGSSSSSSSSSSAWSISTASTELTTPSTSPLSSSALTGWFKPPTTVQSFASRRKSWMTPSLTIPSSPLAADPSASPQSAVLRHSCRSRSRLLPVPPRECPLPLDLLSSTTTSKALLQPLSFDGNLRPRRTRSSSAGSSVKESAGMVVRRVSRFVELAKGFQNAYMNAALFSVCASYETYEDRRVEYEVGGRSERSRSSSSTVDGGKEDNSMGKKQLKPAGYRVSSGDVFAFLDPTLPSSASSNSTSDTDGDISVLSSSSPAASEPPVKYIPLTSPFPPSHPPRTVLPNPLPYTLVFKPIPPTARSPFRFHNTHSFTHTTFPQSTPPADDVASTAAVTWRVRVVGNPVYLRLKALQNVVCRRGTTWDGRGRDSMLGGGRERVLGVAFEGVGRTRLVNSVEVDGAA